MRTLPSIPYSGLSIVLDTPSRFDSRNNHLLSGPAGIWINEITELPVDSIDIRTVDDESPFHPDTTKVALLGEKAAQYYSKVSNDPPGYPLIARHIPATAAFDPQDCNDFRSMTGDDEEHEEKFTERDSKERIPTRHKNRRFWTAWHLHKLLHPFTIHEDPIKPIIYPNLSQVIKVLDSTTNQDIYLDIETSRLHRAISCVGFSTSRVWPCVFVVPYYFIDGSRSYHDLYKFHWVLSKAFTRNQVVIHNASFDLIVLHGWYKTYLPGVFGGSIYDTMVVNHRCFPEVEKSLAHVISQWTGQPNHKDFSTDVYTKEQENHLWIYNAHDVYTLKLIKDAQLAWAGSITGLTASISQANSSLTPYIDNSLKGLPIDQMEQSRVGEKLEKQKALYAKMASILVGKPFNPGSTQQCAKFFHDTLNYPVIAKTAKGAPALGSKQLYQLALKYNNPLIQVIIKYRVVAKDFGMLESELL